MQNKNAISTKSTYGYYCNFGLKAKCVLRTASVVSAAGILMIFIRKKKKNEEDKMTYSPSHTRVQLEGRVL